MPQAVTVSTMDRSGKQPPIIMIPAKNYEHPSLAYIDLDLPKDNDDVFAAANPTGAPSRQATLKTQRNESSNIIYKEVDFEKTKAFNQTRKDAEEQRLQPSELQRT